MYTHLRFTKLISESSLSCHSPLKAKNAQLPLRSASLFTESSVTETASFCSRVPQHLWEITSPAFILLVPLRSDSAPASTCEHAASCQGLNLGFSGRKPGEAKERSEGSLPELCSIQQEGSSTRSRDGRSSAAAGGAAEEKFL